MNYSRQQFLGSAAQETLGDVRVVIAGVGGGGSHIGPALAHIGVRNIALVDPDVLEDHNHNRTVGAFHDFTGLGIAKVTSSASLIRRICPECRVDVVQKPWQACPSIISSADVVFGCLDSFNQRDELERQCRRYLIPYIDIGMDVHEISGRHYVSGQVLLSMPGDVCMWCMGFLTESRLREEVARYGAAGPRPQVYWPNGVLANSAIGVFMQLFAPWNKSLDPCPYLEYDGNLQTVVQARRLEYVVRGQCGHHHATDRGDAVWQGPSVLA
jgi:molybdopterin-synthase adenylyltransferase